MRFTEEHISGASTLLMGNHPCVDITRLTYQYNLNHLSKDLAVTILKVYYFDGKNAAYAEFHPHKPDQNT